MEDKEFDDYHSIKKYLKTNGYIESSGIAWNNEPSVWVKKGADTLMVDYDNNKDKFILKKVK